MLLSFILLLLFFSISANSQCGPAQCYNGCTDSRVPVDFVFIIDISGSMQTYIDGVKSGLTQFAKDLQNKGVIPAYSVVLYGNGKATVKLNAEQTFSTFKQTMDAISTGGGWEATFETIRRVTNSASAENLGISYRSGAKKVIIVLTDEDSDPAYLASNRLQRSGNDGHEQCNVDFSEYQSEINLVFQGIKQVSASTYLLTDIDKSSDFRTSQTCLTKKQYGDFNLQAQSSDYKTFNSAKTLTNLQNAGLGNSLQGRLLEAGFLCRNFWIGLAGDATFIKNFFETITQDVSKCETCLKYECSAKNTCLAPTYICGCDGVPYSGKTTDAWGNCCLPSERDCNGKCFGGASYDLICGVCTQGGTRPAICANDCGRDYLTQKPSVPYITRDNLMDPAGYLLMNPDLYNIFITSGSIQWLRDHFHIYGRFEGRLTCTFDANSYVNSYGGSLSTAKDAWINALLNRNLNPKPAAKCISGTRTRLTNILRDACNQCITFTDAPPYCVLDCSNTLRTNPAQAYFIDECGKCVPPGTSPSANKDSCGVCFGNNAAKNQCGQCHGTKALDLCNQPVCQGSPCLLNCAGAYEPVLTKKPDECGFCVSVGTRSPDCLQDCAGKFYRRGTTAPNKYDECSICVSSSVTRSPQCVADCRPVYLSNPALAYVNDNCGKCVAPGTNLNANKDDCGVCFGNNANKNNCSVCFGTTAIDSCGNYVCRNILCAKNCKGISETPPFTWNLDECGYCQPVVNGVVQRNTSCIQDCAGKYYAKGTSPLNKLDDCNICIPSTKIRNESCINDCRLTVWFTDVAQKYFVDECGKCVPPGTSPSANKDSCGVCFGNNTAKNQCGVCFDTKDLDACNQPICQAKTCVTNCAGEKEPILTKKPDECDYCMPIGQRNSDCVQDCGKIFYNQSQPTTSTHIIDECGNCVLRTQVRVPACVQDCSGKWNGTAYYDNCGQCIDGKDDLICLQDCAGKYYREGKDIPSKTVDECGECNTAKDQNKLKDNCGKCSNFYNSTAECVADCKGQYYLINDPTSNPAFIDIFCAKCWFANETYLISKIVDDCGQCVLGGPSDPDWNKDRAKDIFGNLCSCLNAPNTCTYPNGTTFQYCLDCPDFKVCPSGNPDSCGICPGKSMYGKKDKCGLCCSPEDGNPCDVDVDSCGKCFGFDKDRDTNACKVCNAKTCVIDCFGKVNGTAVPGCDGVCGSTASCLSCGDGKTSPEIGETCDLGNGLNVKGSGCFNCKTEQGSSTGSVIGGVIGGIAAVAFLGVAAFLAFKYAQKNGLIGKSGQKVDLSSSNANPLYTSDTNIQQNPLYGS